MRIVTATEMREIDRATTQKYGVPSLTLMEKAGEAVANFILQPFSAIRLSTSKRGRITVVCGKGNNGGDGFVAARKLQEHGKDVSVIVLADRNDVKGDAKTMLARLP